MKHQKRKTTARKQTIAFNPYFLLWLLGTTFSLWGTLYLALTEGKISWILIVFLIVFLIVLFADSIVYVFTKDEIYFVRFWGHKWRLPWFYVTSITKHNFWNRGGSRELMGYEVYYDQPYKGRLIRKTLLLALTPKVKKCLHTFYCGEIRFETKRKKKKR